MQLLDKARGVAGRLEVTRAQRDALTNMKNRPAEGMVATMQAAVAARERELQVRVPLMAQPCMTLASCCFRHMIGRCLHP